MIRWVIGGLTALVVVLGAAVWFKPGAGDRAKTGRLRAAEARRPHMTPPTLRPTSAAKARDGAGASSEEVAAPNDKPVKAPLKTVDEFLAEVRKIADQRDVEGKDKTKAGHKAEKLLDKLVDLLQADPAQRAAALERFRNEPDPRLLEWLGNALGGLGGPDVEEAMIQIARSDENAGRRRQSLAVLAALDTAAAVPLAAQLLRGESAPLVLAHAIDALPDAPPEGLPAEEVSAVCGDLGRHTASPEADVRVRAYQALGEWGNDAWTPQFIDGLKDAIPSVREEAAMALGDRVERNPAARDALLNVLRNPAEKEEVRAAASEALQGLGEQDAAIRAETESFEAEYAGKDNE